MGTSAPKNVLRTFSETAQVLCHLKQVWKGGIHTDGFHRDHRDVLSRVGAPGHSVTSSLFAFLPSPHSFHSICVKKRSFLTAPPQFTSLWRQPSIASMWVSSLVANNFLQGFYHGQKNLSGHLGLNRHQPQSFHPCLNPM